MKKLSAKVYPVSWSNRKVQKYRAHVECKNGITIYGEPHATKEKAIASLYKEAKRYFYAASLCLELPNIDFKEI